MAGEFGIKETKDVLLAIEALGTKAVVFRDGFQVADIAALTGVIGPVVEAIKDSNLVDDEIKDLDKEELAELGEAALQVIKNIKDAWKTQG